MDFDAALAQFEAEFPTAKYRRENGVGVLREAAGDFVSCGSFPIGRIDPGEIQRHIDEFWRSNAEPDLWNILFDPNSLDPTKPTRARIKAFMLKSATTKVLVFGAPQYREVVDNNGDVQEPEISGAGVTMRLAAQPPSHGQVEWRIDRIESTLVVVANARLTLQLGVKGKWDPARLACSAVFGDASLISDATIGQYNFPGAPADRPCWRVTVPAQPRLKGRQWGRGAIIFWPDDPQARHPLHIEPDGRFASVELEGNVGYYNRGPLTLRVKAGVNGGYQLVDDTLTARGGPTIVTGALDPSDPFTAVKPDWGGGAWTHDPAETPDKDPGVRADVHFNARDCVERLLNMRDAAGGLPIVPVVPPTLNLAVAPRKAAQPGEWRRSSETAVIADSDWRLPPAWMKRWDRCSSSDVVAHEIAHAFLNLTTHFEYKLESGALEEALADLIAILLFDRPELFSGPWNRPSSPIAATKDWLRNGDWIDRPGFQLTPNDLSERGDYPNHYGHYRRLHRDPLKAARRSAPRNDHGYIHWNCAIMTRALAMLAKPSGTMITNPETGLGATAVGAAVMRELVFLASRSEVIPVGSIGNAGAETPFALFRRAVLTSATSSQFDDSTARRLIAVQVLNGLNSAGIGPILSVKGKPALPTPIPDPLMPTPADPPRVRFVQPAGTVVWTPGSGARVRLRRAEPVEVFVRISNLGISADAALPRLLLVLEKTRTHAGAPDDLHREGSDDPPPRVASGGTVELHATLPSEAWPTAFADPRLGVFAFDGWNQLRPGQTFRTAAQDGTYRLPLNGDLLSIDLV